MADQVPLERQYALILVVGGDEAFNHLNTLENQVEDLKDPEQVWHASKKSFKQSTSFWYFRDAHLADFRQDPTESTADLDLCIKETVRGCQWKKETEEEQMIDLLYHATIYYEIRKYIQELKPAMLKYEMVTEKPKAHERNCLEYKDHQASHRGANSMPSYNNPLLSAHAIVKRRPSGQNTCHWCGKSHEQGKCPTYGKVYDKCKGPNHFKAICNSNDIAAKTVPSPYRKKQSQLPTRRTSTGSNSGNGKGGGRQFLRKKKMAKKLPKQKTYEVTFKNSKMVPSGVTPDGGNGKVSQN